MEKKIMMGCICFLVIFSKYETSGQNLQTTEDLVIDQGKQKIDTIHFANDSVLIVDSGMVADMFNRQTAITSTGTIAPKLPEVIPPAPNAANLGNSWKCQSRHIRERHRCLYRYIRYKKEV